MPLQALLQQVGALLLTQNTLQEINAHLVTITSSVSALSSRRQTVEAQLLQQTLQLQHALEALECRGGIESGDELRRELQQIRLQVEFMKARMTTFLGAGTALTYLADETPFYVNAPDFGGPATLIDGGKYEPDNLEVLLSFVREDSVFLDIGANLGFFSIQIGKRVRHAGKVYAFEPHPEMVRLLCASAHLNGLSAFDGQSGTVIVKNFGVSDRDEHVHFNYPRDVVGGGTLNPLADGQHERVASQVRRLDHALPADFKCDLVKIDVEGHELNVLRGMEGILTRSPDVKILFEKFGIGQRSEGETATLLRSLGFDLFLVDLHAQLKILDDESFYSASGYIVAIRPVDSPMILDRRRFHIYPRQLSVNSTAVQTHTGRVLHVSGASGDILFHGPYWFLQRGVYLVRLHGEIQGRITISVAARLGYHLLDFELSAEQCDTVIVVPNDVVQFECVARAASATAFVTLDSLEWVRQG